MTQEEKAKRYNEALEIAKKNYITAQDLHEGSQIGVECFKNTLENIFPELKESENERIRKEIIQFIKKRDRSGCDYDYDQWITWLEKQGKQKPTEWSEEEQVGMSGLGLMWQKKAFIEKACEWMKEALIDYWSGINADSSNFINDFKRAMEEQV